MLELTENQHQGAELWHSWEILTPADRGSYIQMYSASDKGRTSYVLSKTETEGDLYAQAMSSDVTQNGWWYYDVRGSVVKVSLTGQEEGLWRWLGDLGGKAAHGYLQEGVPFRIWRCISFSLFENRFGCFQSGADGRGNRMMQILRAALRPPFWGGTGNHWSWKMYLKWSGLSRSSFHCRGSMNKVCQRKDRFLVVLHLFCTLSCNLELGKIITVIKMHKNLHPSQDFALRFCFVRNSNKMSTVILHENGAQGNDLQSFRKKLAFTLKLTNSSWKKKRTCAIFCCPSSLDPYIWERRTGEATLVGKLPPSRSCNLENFPCSRVVKIYSS